MLCRVDLVVCSWVIFLNRNEYFGKFLDFQVLELTPRSLDGQNSSLQVKVHEVIVNSWCQ